MISIIPSDETIVIDGVAIQDTEQKRVSAMLAPDIHAIQFDDQRNIGEVEYVNDPFWQQVGGEYRQNEPITAESFDFSAIRAVHAAVLEEDYTK
jgi:hypothetical protein